MTQLLTATAASSGALSAVGSQSSGADYTMLFCIISLLICIALPTGIILLGKLKYEGSLKQVWWGMAGYVLFYFVLPAILPALVHTLFMPDYMDQTATSLETSVVTVLRIACGVLGLFLISVWTRKRNRLGDALNLGAGFFLMECLYIAFLMVAYIVVITSEDVDSIYIVREMRIFVQSNNLVEGQEWRFIMKGLTAVIFTALQLSSAVVVFVGVQKKSYWMALFAVGFGLAIRLPNRLHDFDSWIWGNYAVIIPYLIIASVIVSLIAYVIWKHHKDEVTAIRES